MRVLINAMQAGNRSGTGRYTTELIQALLPFHKEIQLTVLWPEDVFSGDFGAHAEIICRPQAPLRRTIFSSASLKSLTAGRHVDLVHQPANFGAALPWKPMVLTVHDLSFLHHPEWFRWDRALYYRHAIKSSVCRATRIIADSQATANDLAELLRYPESRIDVIPLGVREEFRPAAAEACAEARDRYHLPERFYLYVGTLEPRKNLARLVEAWSRVAGDGVPDLVLAGRQGWKIGPLKRAIAESPYRARIHCPGYIAASDLPAVLTAAHAFVWPSLFEGFGLPPLEAMACGTPVLTSNTSSLPEVVGRAALTVDPLDAEAIADALKRIAEDSNLRRTLQDSGFARALQFTWARTAQLTVAAYQKAAPA
jgi:glycosyltransferase involved in cell wall biosynthesis